MTKSYIWLVQKHLIFFSKNKNIYKLIINSSFLWVQSNYECVETAIWDYVYLHWPFTE